MIILDSGTTFSNHICKFITICDYVYCSTNIFNLTLILNFYFIILQNLKEKNVYLKKTIDLHINIINECIFFIFIV